MAARLVIFKDSEPEIGIILEYTPPGTGKARGWYGACTQCGKKVHYWNEERAFLIAQEHVDSH